MEIFSYEVVFKNHLIKVRSVSLARALSAAHRNEFITQFSHRDWREAKRQITDAEARAIKEVLGDIPPSDDFPSGGSQSLVWS